MIAYLVVALLALGGIAYIARALTTAGRVAGSDGLEEALARKDAALGTLADLEDDHAMGKLSDADYSELRASFESDAVLALRGVEVAQHSEGGDPLETAVAGLRSAATCPTCGDGLDHPGDACERCDA